MILVDAHVHIYDCFNLQVFFDSALTNFKAEAARRSVGAFTGLLLLAETAREDWFKRLNSYACEECLTESRIFKNWTFHSTNESCSLWARGHEDQGLYLIAGRQITTEENLEVLALATDREFEDGAPLEVLIKAVKSCDAIPVIPWSAGKWFGKRGRLLEDYLKQVDDSYLFLGDTGTRLSFWPNPSHFQLSANRGIGILAGTDPLPLPFEECRAGSYGSMIPEHLNSSRPSSHLKELLRHNKTTVVNYGNLERPFRFFRNQLLLRIKKVKIK